MKRMFNCFMFVICAALISGLAGCADKKTCSPCATTQPQCASSQPACDDECEMSSCNEECEMVVECVEERRPMERQGDRMIHNAELADMTVTDIHFLPHRDALNSTGTQRLSHLAWLVDKYGGTIKLDLKDPESELSQARLETVKAYLKTRDLPECKIKVQIGLSENEGMSAKEGIEIYNESRKPKDK